MIMISGFMGIMIYIMLPCSEKCVHAVYAGEKVVMSFRGDVIAGSLPRRQQALLEAWIILREKELEKACANIKKGNYNKYNHVYWIKPIE